MKAGEYLESKNRKYRLGFQNSGLHLCCGTTTIWKYYFSKNEALYFDPEGSTLVLLNAVENCRPWLIRNYFHKSIAFWNASTGRYGNKLVLQNNEICFYLMITTKLCGKRILLEHVLQVWNNLLYFKCNSCFKMALKFTALFQVKIRQTE